MQMKIITSLGQQIGVSATTGLHTFDGSVPYPTGAVRTYPGYTGGGTGMGIVEWLTVGHPESGFPSSATSAYTWMSSLYGIIGYSVSISFSTIPFPIGITNIILLPA